MLRSLRTFYQIKVIASNRKSACFPYQFSLIARKSTTQFLPSLPVPNLKNTMEKYLRSVKPTLTEEEYCRAKEAVKTFLTSKNAVGPQLQIMLEERAKNTSNWLYEWWINDFFLSDRLPLVVHSNPALIMPRQKFKHPEMYIGFAAKVISAVLCYKSLVDGNDIPVDTARGDPLDMSQNFNLFGTCRIPAVSKDTLLILDPYKPPNHIIVAHNNHFFRVPVLDSCEEPISVNQIEAQLQIILQNSKDYVKPIGILTSEHRDKWAVIHQELIQDKENRECLKQIETALFLVCLDGKSFQQNASQPMNLQSLQAMKILHGCGAQDSSGNRWFDKTLQLVIGCTGEFGLLLEPTAIGVQVIMNLLNYVMDSIEKKQHDLMPPESVQFPQPVRLNFKLGCKFDDAIKNAEIKLKQLVDDTDVLFYTYTGYGMDFIKSNCLSPDAFIQMAIQLAFYRVHFETVPTHEFASIRKFCHGRTETIRTLSFESVHFVNVMIDNSKTTNMEKMQALRAAIDCHVRNTKEASSGKGIDNHLFGLKMVAIQNGIDVPDFLVNDVFIRSTSWRLYTGQVRTSHNGGLCLGPATCDGYGIGYNPRENSIIFGLTAYHTSSCTNLKLFHDALNKSLGEMCNLLIQYKTEDRKKGI